MKGERDLVGIERLLGLKSARGISRQKNLDSPPIKAILDRIKAVSKDFVNSSNGEIRTSQALKGDAHAVFQEYGPLIWPGPAEARPSWLEEPSATLFNGKYPRHLYYTQSADRAILWEHFYHLVVQKCCNYHDNQLQKSRRSSAKLRTDDSELTPPRNDDSPDSTDSDIEVTASDRPSWLPINQSDARPAMKVPLPVTSMGSSPVMEQSTFGQNGPPGVYAGSTDRPEDVNGISQRLPIPSPAVSPYQNSAHKQSSYYRGSTGPGLVNIDETRPASVDEPTSDYLSESDITQKRKRPDTGDDDYVDDEDDDRLSKRMRNDSEEAAGHDDSLVVKLKVNNRALALFTNKANANLRFAGGPTGSVGTRTRSSSIARSSPYGDGEGTQVNVKQYKDSKGKWYEVNIEGRPHWAVDEKVITRFIPPERRRSTWVSRHAANSPNTLSMSETRGSMGAASVSSRPSPVAGPEALTGRRDSVRSEEQRERKALVSQEPAHSAPVHGGESDHAEVGKTKMEPDLEPEPEAPLLAAIQAFTSPEPESSPEKRNSVPTADIAGDIAGSQPTASDEQTQQEKQPETSDATTAQGETSQRTEQDEPRNMSQPPAFGAPLAGHSKKDPKNATPDRNISASEPPAAVAPSPQANHLPKPSVLGSTEPLPRAPTAPVEPREPRINAIEGAHSTQLREGRVEAVDGARSFQPPGSMLSSAPTSLQGAPWPSNSYATGPPNGSWPMQAQMAPFNPAAFPHSHTAPPGQDAQTLHETARFRVIDHSASFNGLPQQPPRSRQTRPEILSKSVAPVSALIHHTEPTQHIPHHPTPHVPHNSHRNSKSMAPMGSNAHVPSNTPNGLPVQHQPSLQIAPPAPPPPVPQPPPIAPKGHAPHVEPERQRAPAEPDSQLVFDVLGELANCPVGKYIRNRCPDLMIDRDLLCVVKETLLRFPAARADWPSLEKALKRECQDDEYYCGAAIDKHQKASIEQTQLREGKRKVSLPPPVTSASVNTTTAPKVLPTLAAAPPPPPPPPPGVTEATGPLSSLPVPAQKVKPAKQSAMEAPVRAHPPALPSTGMLASTPTPVIPSNGHSTRMLTTAPPTPQSRGDIPPSPSPSPMVKGEEGGDERVNNTFIEINWGREEVEHSDNIIMQNCRYCRTADDFFAVIEHFVPDELRGLVRRVKEIRVKALSELRGKERLPRFIRDDGSIRAGMHRLVKILRAQPLGAEPELEFFTLWE